MPLTVNRAGRWSWRILLPWLVGLAPLLCGLAVMHWQTQAELRALSQSTATQAAREIDAMLDQLDDATHALLPLAGQPCERVSQALRQQVTSHAFIRSTNLGWRDTLYCTSLMGHFKESIDVSRYVDGRLLLMPGNEVTPSHPVLIYRAGADARSVLVGLDGLHLVLILRLLGADTELSVWIGGEWLDKRGVVMSQPFPTPPVAAVQVHSIRYPFIVSAGFAAGKVGERMRDHYPPILGLLLILGAVCGGVCRWQLRKVHSPHAELQRAMNAGEFVPFLQPLVDTTNGHWAGAEVLLRWRHPRDGLVGPELFIPYAEHSGQIVEMTQRMMTSLARQLAPYAHHLREGFHIGINITADHCQDLRLVHDCKTFLAQFPPGRVVLNLELTERKLLRASPVTWKLFEQLHALGVTIALDDFGTGQSSLAYLRQFQVDYLKIDRGFVALIGGDALSVHILDTIIELSARLGLGAIAEGVETPAQRDYLIQNGVTLQQGYLFARPMSVATFIDAIMHDNGATRLPKPTPPEIMPG
ncbi:EAL domain-containing protein [Pseudomonas monteilii]|uniref:EAL domain-containing protein n=1 Tax=Pseudomonas alabamensis TaxID=3064349 RepID=UPI002713BB2E|nr:EAL domain-containing protein [Pseudomonas sp. 22-AL-CL-001]MDO7912325.1 EAL domain-containing protein [Pseudomonas sp. 22-AL-CL-001]